MTLQLQAKTVLEQLESSPERLRDNWCIPREAGRLLHVLVLTQQAQTICEIGTSIGYSTLWLATAARQTGGQVHTIEYYAQRQEQAKQAVQTAGLSDRVTFHLGEAIPLLEAWQTQRPSPCQDRGFDLVFIDAAKKEYITYVQLLTPLMATGGLLVADNTRSHRDEMQDFLAWMERSDLFDSAEIETSNGQWLARKR